jgi:hypothetical protein
MFRIMESIRYSIVRDEDMLQVALLNNVEGEEELELYDSWDAI